LTINPGNGYIITLRQIEEIGSPWIVRVHRKRILGKKLISSDWFLNEDQARRFVKDLEKELSEDKRATLRSRKPGWTFHQAS
jgi:hypothetical protein